MEKPPTGHLPEVVPAERAPPPMSHPPPQVEGVVSSANNAPPPASHASNEERKTTRIEQREAALHVALKQMKSQHPPRPPLKTITALQMEGGNNNDDNAASSQAPVLRQQAAAAVDAMSRRQLSAGAVNVESGRRTKMPRVYARGRGPGNNGETTTVHGFLHRFDTVEALSILCMCHGLCHTPAQFVEHAGGGAAERERPLKHIVVVDAADYFAHQTPSSSSSHRPF